jgi:hypothetical protein
VSHESITEKARQIPSSPQVGPMREIHLEIIFLKKKSMLGLKLIKPKLDKSYLVTASLSAPGIKQFIRL